MADVKVSILEIDGIELDGPTEHKLLASELPVSPIPTLPTITNVQEGLEKLPAANNNDTFHFGKADRVSNLSWLHTPSGSPSNVAGLIISGGAPILTKIAVSCEAPQTFDVEIYEHFGNLTSLTFITTINLIATNSIQQVVSFPLTIGAQLATIVAGAGSGNNRPLNVNVILNVVGN